MAGSAAGPSRKRRSMAFVVRTGFRSSGVGYGVSEAGGEVVEVVAQAFDGLRVGHSQYSPKGFPNPASGNGSTGSGNASGGPMPEAGARAMRSRGVHVANGIRSMRLRPVGPTTPRRRRTDGLKVMRRGRVA